MADYTNAAQQRLLQAIQILSGKETHGLSPTEIALALKTSPSTVTRDLANLQEAGWAEEIQQTGRWRLGPKPVQISRAFADGLARAQQQLDEIAHRYTRQFN